MGELKKFDVFIMLEREEWKGVGYMIKERGMERRGVR